MIVRGVRERAGIAFAALVVVGASVGCASKPVTPEPPPRTDSTFAIADVGSIKADVDAIVVALAEACPMDGEMSSSSFHALIRSAMPLVNHAADFGAINGDDPALEDEAALVGRAGSFASDVIAVASGLDAEDFGALARGCRILGVQREVGNRLSARLALADA